MTTTTASIKAIMQRLDDMEREVDNLRCTVEYLRRQRTNFLVGAATALGAGLVSAIVYIWHKVPH